MTPQPEVLARFSALAAGVLVALVAAGLLPRVADRRLLGRPGQHRVRPAAAGQDRDSSLVAVAIAAWNRYRLLPALRASTGSAAGEPVPTCCARSLVAEAAALVVVLVITGFLVDRSPQAEASAVDRARNGVQTATLGDVEAAGPPHAR